LPVRAGTESMIGKTVTALTPIDSRGGRIFIEGEYWKAVSDTPIEQGEMVKVAAVDGLTLKVKSKGA
jgi:membrane-bound serine protease (ClpP class)